MCHLQGRLSEDRGVLFLSNVTAYDSGQYSCKVNLLDGDARIYTDNTTVHVLGK